MYIDNTLLLPICLCLGFGLGGWIIHLYTLIKSGFSTPKRWVIRIEFNCFKEAIPELIIFTLICILFAYTLIAILGVLMW